MKVLTDLGDTAYVQLDSPGNVVYEGKDRTMIVSQNVSVVPEAKQIGTYQCATIGSGVCGIAYDCEGEVCTLTKSIDSPDQPIRTVLTTASKPSETRLTLAGSPVAYPVVRYSDTISNPSVTKRSIILSTSSIRNATYQECIENWNEYKKATMEMTAASDDFMRTYTMAMNQIAADLKRLGNYRAEYIRNPPVTVVEKEKFDAVVFNINNRNQLLIGLFGICQVVRGSTDAIKEQTSALQQSTKNLKEMYQDLGKVVKGYASPLMTDTI
jgi:hypothetical protein